MRFVALLFCIVISTFSLSGCFFVKESTSEEVVRTFEPSNVLQIAQEEVKGQEKRGILFRTVSPGKTKCAYLFTFDASAEPVEYSLAILDKNQPFNYLVSDVIYTSENLFEIEWGDDATLMVSLHEKELKVPAPLESDEVMVMFGQVSRNSN